MVNCSARAVESDRPDRLIDDPLAARFVHTVRIRETLPTQVDELERSGAAGAMVASRFGGIRARVMDDFLLAADAAGVDEVQRGARPSPAASRSRNARCRSFKADHRCTSPSPHRTLSPRIEPKG
ncbi:class I SAM-dependent methyltransferase [Streptomyces sp. NPDC058701]|uniref:class I SAM-dependent methyltransferase n=1 Tax=Streptomyces sp. NPDC058701 TaxID=3346608 RepID=UPI003663293E